MPWLLLLLALAAWVLTTLLVPLTLPLAGAGSLPPAARARRQQLVAAAPWLLPAAVVAAASLLAGLKQLGVVADHCLYHGSHQPHLCFLHGPAIEPGVLPAAGLIGLAGVLGLAAARFVARESVTRARLGTLLRLSRGAGRLRVLEEARPLALAVGLREASVLVSRGLLEQLSPRERRAAVAHEIAHVRHRDALRNLVLEVLLLLHPAPTARRLRAHWRQALEERADDAVVERFGADALASAVLKTARGQRPDIPAAFSAAGADPARRIARLLHPSDEPKNSPLFEASYIALLLASMTSVIALHHALEHLLGAVLGV